MNIKVMIFNNLAIRDDVISYNGDFILDDICISCSVKEDINGDFQLDADFLIDLSKPEDMYRIITEDSILKIKDEYGYEYFRISSVRKTNKRITVVARQITIADTLNLWLDDVRPTDLNTSSALNHLLTNAIGNKEIFVGSDLNKTSTAYYEGMSMYQAISDSENSIIKRWGGEIERRGYNLFIRAQRGEDSGMHIRSKKNLTGFSISSNLDDVCTVIFPKGFDRLKGDPVYSAYANSYSSYLPREVKFENIKVATEDDPDGFATEQEALEALKKEAEKMFTDGKVDILKATYDIDFVNLSKTEEYKNYSHLENANIGDLVSVTAEEYDIDIKTRVIAREYNVLSEKRTKTTLSNKDVTKNTITVEDLLVELNSQQNQTNSLAGYITGMINQGIVGGYVTVTPSEILITDNKDIYVAKDVARFNKNGLGFSRTGYFGEYTTGITLDGKINASLISVGILSTILITNADNSLQIDLSGTQGIKFNKNGHSAIEISGNELVFNDWEGSEREYPTGFLFSGRRRKGGEVTNLPGLILANEKWAYTAISYRNEKTGGFSPYVEFDFNRILEGRISDLEREAIEKNSFNNSEAITFNEGASFNGKLVSKYILYIGDKYNSSIYQTSTGNLVNTIPGDKRFVIADSENYENMLHVGDGEFAFYRNNEAYMWRTKAGDRIMIDDDVQINGDLFIGGNVRGQIRDLNGNVIFPSGGGSVSEGIPSANLYRFVKGYEGFGANPYRVPGENFYTAGYGVTENYQSAAYNRLKPFPCSEKTASIVYGDMLINNFSKPLLQRMKKDGVDISRVKQNHFDAFCSLAMNGGLGAVTTSPMYATWKSNPNDPSIPQRWLTWYINPGTAVESGLRARRKAEANIWTSSKYEFRRIVKILSNGNYSGYVTDNNGNGYIPPIFGTINTRDVYSNDLSEYKSKKIDIELISDLYNKNGIKLPTNASSVYEKGETIYLGDEKIGDVIVFNFFRGVPTKFAIITKIYKDKYSTLLYNSKKNCFESQKIDKTDEVVLKRIL